MSGSLLATIRNRVTAAWYTIVGSANTDDGNGSGTATLTASFNTNGTITFTTSTGDAVGLQINITHWHNGGTVTGIGSSRWAKKTLVEGDITSGTLTTTLVALSANRTMAISLVAGEGRSGTYLVEIYSDSGGTTKVGEVIITLTVAP